MIRFIYWLLAIIEVLLLLGVLLLFIVTDSRSIKYIAKTSLEDSGISYESIEGNLFDGLELRDLRYHNRALFSLALLHWNPLTLLNDKITITKLDVEGVEVGTLMAMLNAMQPSDADESGALDFEVTVKRTHIEINPYVYEGVKFSSFLFDTGEITLDKNLNINTEHLHLKFDSDIVNVEMDAKIKESVLLVDSLGLKDISVEAITTLTHRLKANHTKEEQKTKVEKQKEPFFLKAIKIKNILATMQAVRYGDLKIKGATLKLNNSYIDPADNFNYQVEALNLRGATNFGKLNYEGEVKDANIYAKGEIELNRELFKKYQLPLRFKVLKKLPSSLHLNHDAVWIEIEHEAKQLLKLKSDFNLDVNKGKHQLHYDYEEGIFRVNSELKGAMDYAKEFTIENQLQIDDKGLGYEGEVQLSNLQGLPKVASDYLLKEIKGEYRANSNYFEMRLDTALLSGELSLLKYKHLDITLKSKSSNIELEKLISNLPHPLKNEQLALQVKGDFDFQNIKKSQIDLLVQSDTLNTEASLKLKRPYEVTFFSTLKSDTRLKSILPRFNFKALKTLNGSVKLNENDYLVNVKSDELELFLHYNKLSDTIQKGMVNLAGERFYLEEDGNKNLNFQTKIENIQALSQKLNHYYDFDIPNIQGKMEIELQKQPNGTFVVNLKSPKLQYLSENSVELSVLNIYNIETKLTIDKALNIELQNYQFNLDDNGYLSSFFSHRSSYLKLDDEETIKIKKLWLNDQIEIEGEYDLKRLLGELKLSSTTFRLSNKDFSLLLGLDLELLLNKEKIEIEGDIDILGDTITYEVVGSDIVEDADIVIMEEILKQKESAFNNLKLYLKIKSKKPLRYIAEKVNIEFLNELSVVKNYNQKMLVTGVSTITKGYYQLEDKQFFLDESLIYFTGDVKNPLLDIKANYEKDEYNVHIFISGTTDAPIVNFNAEPYLTQQEILSLILFDGTGSSSGKGAEAYTLLGGSFAKGLIKSLGVDVDHLLLGKDAQEELSLEIGKRVSKNVSVLYLHKDGLDGVKVQVEHSKNFETDIIIQPPNTSSIEFLYKQDR